MSNERAKEWLESHGFACEEEPDWIEEGQKPDFFCTGPFDLWVEVKTLGPEERFESLADAHVILRERTQNIRACANGVGWVKSPVSHKDVKTAVEMLKRELCKEDLDLSSEEIIVIVPNDPIYGEFSRFSFTTQGGPQVNILSVRSQSGKYTWPMTLEPNPYHQVINVICSDRRSMEVNLDDIADYSNDFSVAIQLSHSDSRFRLLSTAPVEGAERVRSVDRIRNSISEANSQFKNASRYRNAANLTIVFHDDVMVSEDAMVLSAVYGDLAVSFGLGDQQELPMRLTQNGVFAENKNTTTSALCYIRNDLQPLIIPNYWANMELPNGVLKGKYLIPQEEGGFDETVV